MLLSVWFLTSLTFPTPLHLSVHYIGSLILAHIRFKTLVLTHVGMRATFIPVSYSETLHFDVTIALRCLWTPVTIRSLWSLIMVKPLTCPGLTVVE